ncbi:hypothetical protein GQ457_14G022830 [Hibiscus cannabinus]
MHGGKCCNHLTPLEITIFTLHTIARKPRYHRSRCKNFIGCFWCQPMAAVVPEKGQEELPHEPDLVPAVKINGKQIPIPPATKIKFLYL